jgi:hypothetical protein
MLHSWINDAQKVTSMNIKVSMIIYHHLSSSINLSQEMHAAVTFLSSRSRSKQRTANTPELTEALSCAALDKNAGLVGPSWSLAKWNQQFNNSIL